MKKVLIVSDNFDLISHFKIISKTIPSNIAMFDYSYSVINKSPDKLKKLDMSIIDMKNADNVDSIIANYDLVISAHCKQIFPENLVNGVRCINIHPGLNPHNRGWYPQVFSIINKKPIGCTIHLMDAEIDHGDVIYQKEVDVNSWDTSLDVYNRVVDAEKELINRHLHDLVSGNYELNNLKDDGNYNGIKDFNKLLNLELSSNGTLGEHIDLLRALTHGNFNNAFFIDNRGNKVFVRLFLENENS
jgi:methionyl-tRNA formyltransferase